MRKRKKKRKKTDFCWAVTQKRNKHNERIEEVPPVAEKSLIPIDGTWASVFMYRHTCSGGREETGLQLHELCVCARACI